MAQDAPLLELTGVTKSFGGLSVLSDLTFKIGENEVVGILGPNGAGKSTLFNIIAGVLKPTAGMILFHGQDIGRQRAWERCKRGIARTYQIPKPFAHMTVFENVLVATVHGAGLSVAEGRRKASDALERTGLTAHVGYPAGSLRLLDLKRLELARALASDPEILLLDEIAGGLTDRECDELVALVRAINEDGKTIVWVEHVMEALRNACSRLVVLHGGTLVADGHPEAVLAGDEVRSVYLGERAGSAGASGSLRHA
jgi:branched-chain amino acid transport system ATP-binding protein